MLDILRAARLYSTPAYGRKQMDIAQQEHNDVLVLAVKGSLVRYPESSPLIETIRLAAEAKKKVVIDMAEVDWMDSVGIGILLACFMTVRNRSGELKVARPTKKIMKLLEVTNLLSIIRTFDTVEAAVESFSA